MKLSIFKERWIWNLKNFKFQVWIKEKKKFQESKNGWKTNVSDTPLMKFSSETVRKCSDKKSLSEQICLTPQVEFGRIYWKFADFDEV